MLSLSGATKADFVKTMSNSLASHVQSLPSGGKILLVSDIKGNFKHLNDMIQETGADAVIHTGGFGFYNRQSIEKMSVKSLRHVIQRSSFLSFEEQRRITHLPDNRIKSAISSLGNHSISQIQLLLDGSLELQAPVYTIWGYTEDITMVEDFREGKLSIKNLHIVDETNSPLINIGGISLRILGIGGGFISKNLFDNGEGRLSIAGSQGSMWVTALQIGKLIETSRKTFNSTEVRVFLSNASPGTEGLMAQLAMNLKADQTISAGFHLRSIVSYTDFSVISNADEFKAKLINSKTHLMDLWNTVKSELESVASTDQKKNLDLTFSLIQSMPLSISEEIFDEMTLKNCWHTVLSDASSGHVLWKISHASIKSETVNSGVSYTFRRKAAFTHHTPNVKLGESNPANESVQKEVSQIANDTAFFNKNVGLWLELKDSSIDSKEVTLLFAQEDQDKITRVEKKVAKSKRVYFLVYFNAKEEAIDAKQRVDMEKVSKIDIAGTLFGHKQYKFSEGGDEGQEFPTKPRAFRERGKPKGLFPKGRKSRSDDAQSVDQNEGSSSEPAVVNGKSGVSEPEAASVSK